MARAMGPLSLLFVTTRFPHPQRSGDRARAHHQLRLLARRHRLTLLTFASAAEAARTPEAIAEHGLHRIITVPFSPAAAAWRLATALFSRRPLQAALFDAPPARRALARLLAAERFDLLHVQLARAMPLVPPDPGLPLVVDLIDALSLNMQRRAAHDRGLVGAAARIDATRLAACERRICERAAATLVVAEADRAAIGGGRSPIVNPNGVDLGAFPWREGRGERDQLVFSGNLGYFPNVDAAAWFIERVLPIVRRDEPRTRVTLAGARPHARLRALAARDPRIAIAGDVDDVHPYLAAARVALAPMRAGSGQLLKILEAMATGVPVVTTSRGLSGIEASPGEHVLVADEPEAFARHVVTLMRDDRLAAAQAAAARGLVERLYTWDRSVAQLERIYAEVLGRAGRAASCA